MASTKDHLGLMQKREFRYRQLRFIVVWMLALGAPFILLVPDLLYRIEGVKYYIVNISIMIVLVFVLWRLMNVLPGIQRKGYYWNENGITVLEYGGRIEKLNQVTELFLSDRHASSQGINLLVRNNGRKIELLSEALDKGTGIEDTSFYNIFSQILAENPHLEQEKDIWGESIDYWYKAR